MKTSRGKQSGFTVLELMVAVSVVGILAMIAIQSFQGYKAKARNTEAKIALAAIYTAETSFAAESGSFTACLANIGFAPDSRTRYFRVGFSSTQATGTGCGPNSNQPCDQVEWPLDGSAGRACAVNADMNPAEPYVYPATVRMDGAPAIPDDSLMPQTAPLSKGQFVALAVSGAPLIASAGPGPGLGTQVALGALDLLATEAQASQNSGPGNNNGNQGPGGGGSQSGSGGTQQAPPPPPPPCTQTVAVWTMDSDRKLSLTEFCL
ncbi:MAG TPA: prepilin-type N-terminal cleavage/methylation domain-containing protein [Bdellovibrionota bacterium]|nr:prepilin-type N-terminal cleavage/methylation domain-containing protein [Bdellovibrionota bacterium]